MWRIWTQRRRTMTSWSSTACTNRPQWAIAIQVGFGRCPYCIPTITNTSPIQINRASSTSRARPSGRLGTTAREWAMPTPRVPTSPRPRPWSPLLASSPRFNHQRILHFIISVVVKRTNFDFPDFAQNTTQMRNVKHLICHCGNGYILNYIGYCLGLCGWGGGAALGLALSLVHLAL